MAYFRCGGAGIPASLKSGMNDVLNKKFGTSTTYPPSDWPSDVNLLGPLPVKTASGAIASFPDGADEVPLKELIFSASPIQAAGTPSPSNPLPISGHTSLTGVHCGKNLFDISSLNVSPVSVSDGVATGTGNNFYTTFRNGIPNIIVPQTQFTISAKAYTTGTSGTTGNGLFIRIFYTDGTNDTVYFLNSDSSYTTRSLTSNANKTASAIGISCSTNGGNTWGLKEVQLEVGSQATTYAPYSAESKKWEFPPFGKNLIQEKTYQRLPANLHIGTDTLDGRLSLKSGTYTLSLDCNISSGNTLYYVLDGASAVNMNASMSGTRLSASFTLANDTDDIFFYIYNSSGVTAQNVSNLQLEKSSSVTAYEPYQSMFSGQVNALTGGVEITHKKVLIDGVNLYGELQSSGIMNIKPNGVIDAQTPFSVATAALWKCDKFTISTNDFGYNENQKFFFFRSGVWEQTGATTQAEFNAYCQQNPIEILFPLATPISIDMDSVDWQSKYADNNLFCDTGDTECEYRADIALALGQ